MVGGGVLGKGAGTAHGIINQVGDTIMGFQLSTEGCLQDGGMITGRIVGMTGNGIINEYLTRNFNRFIKGIIGNNPDGNLK